MTGRVFLSLLVNNRSNLATANWNSVFVRENCFLVDEHVLDAILLLPANWGTCWLPECLLDLLSFALRSTCLTNVRVVCCGSDVFSSWSFCNTAPVLLLSLRLKSCGCRFSRYLSSFRNPPKNVCWFPCDTNGSLRCNQLFSLWTLLLKKKTARVVSILKQLMTFVRTCLLSWSLAPRNTMTHLQYVCLGVPS